jgi:hypothetical protein
MDTRWSAALWQQFGATIDMLDNALLACPPSNWEKPLWSDPDWDGAFWRIAFHTLYWLDFYLSGSTEEIALPAPFTRNPQRTYTKDELRTYLVYARKKCQTTIAALTDEAASRQIEYPWIGSPISFFELLLYTMRHVQEHAAQLGLFLGLNASDEQTRNKLNEDLDWVPRARSDHASE